MDNREPNVYGRQDYSKGKRIELHPATDRWMRGDRFGTVIGRVKGKPCYWVRLDKSNKRIKLHECNVGQWID